MGYLIIVVYAVGIMLVVGYVLDFVKKNYGYSLSKLYQKLKEVRNAEITRKPGTPGAGT